jgi:hypothetical protein
MKTFTQVFRISLITLIGFFSLTTQGQSILNPADSVITYNPAKPPTQPTWGSIGKWVRTVRLPWNTTGYKCYIYEGNQFRLFFPKSYNPTANDGKKYPMMIFDHGEGEAGTIYDNEYSLYHGGQIFANAVTAGTFDGYILVMQTTGGWGTSQFNALANIIDYMVTNNKLDPFRVSGNGLSGGGQGVWFNFEAFPTYFATILPMSSDAIQLTASNYVTEGLYTPIWNIHGGLDGSPAPSTASQVNSAMLAAGANYIDLDMTTQGHDTWDSTWSMAGFWPFLLKGYSSNPWTLFGRTLFCTGNPINLTVGVEAGFQAYQWRQNGVIIPGATSNTITVTQLGTYDARVERNGNWSNWSPLPVVIAINPPTVTPPISLSGLMSDAIPATDGKTFVNLQVPNNYVSYTWEKVGSSTVLGTSQIFPATSPGQYVVQVTQQFGCSSNFSPPFTVINANGSNPPSAATNLVANPLSFTQVSLVWARNPNPVNPERAFEVYRATQTGGPYTYVGQAPADTVHYTDINLTPNTKYYYVIRAIDSTAAAPLSNEAVVTTLTNNSPPTAPPNLHVVTYSSSSVSLAWNSSTDNVAVTGYFIYVNGAKSYATAANDTTFIVADLIANQTYTFYVVAVDGSGNVSSKSDQVSAPTANNGLSYNYYTTATAWSVLPNFSTLTPVLSGNMPNVSIAGATQTSNFGYTWQGYITIPVTGTYTFATASDDGSDLWFNSVGANGAPTVNNDGAHGTQTRTSALLNLTAGVYPIFIEYFQAGGGSAMSISWSSKAAFGNTTLIPIANSYFVTPFTAGGTPPAYPTLVTASATAYNKVNIGWTDNSNNETGFEVYRATFDGGPYTIVTTTNPNVTSIVDSTVQASTTYFYRVQAINQYGGSGYDSASTSGIAYSYYTGGTYTKLPAFNTLTPAATGILNNISLSPALATTEFAFKFLGFINIPTTGSYTFYTTSDDGSNLYVGGFDSAHLVVKNDFAQGATQRSGTVSLNQGRYPLYVTYFQGTGGSSLVAAYKGPGIAMQNIPDSVFYNKSAKTTTFALPAAPSAPYNLTVSSLASSKVGLSWKDSSASVTSYQLYRSISDAVHFTLLSTLGAGITSYTDSSLFSNVTYYYKILARGVGGNSAYSPQVTATTLDNLPVITKLPANEQARYGVATVIQLSATSVNAGTLSFAAYNLPVPSFSTFVDNGNRTATLTLNPSSSNQGTYPGIYIVVTDAFGGTDTTKFTLTVNNNIAPVLNNIPNYTMNEGDTLTIPLIGTDQNPGDLLTLAASNAPAGFTVTQISNGFANLFVHPSYAAAGTYTVQATINDNNGMSTSQNFSITVNYKNPNQRILTRMVYQDGSLLPAWNGLTGPVTTNLHDSSGNPTTIGLSFTNPFWWNPFNGGSSTGNNSGVYPDPVLTDYNWFGSIYGAPNVINGIVNGLDTTQYYTLTFFANSVYNGEPNNGITTYTVGTQTVSLAVQNNQQNTVSIPSIKPASDGTIAFNMGLGPNTVLGYINAIVITKQYNDGTAPAGVSNLKAVDAPSQVQLSWQDSAYNAVGYQVWRALASNGVYSLLNTVPGNTANAYVDSSVTGNTVYKYEVRATNSNGNSAFDSVSTTTLNRLPKITAIANVSLVDTQLVTLNITTTDDPTAQLTLTAANLPPFVTFTDNGNGTGTMTIAPTVGTVGIYQNIQVTVADQLDSTASTSFTLAVTEPNVQSVYVNFTGGPVSPQPWNSFTSPPFAGTTLSNLLDASNTPSGISVDLLDGFSWFGFTGWVTGNSDGVYPTSVIQNFYYDPSSATRRMQVSGLDNSKFYNFVFFNSQYDGIGGLTNFTINSTTVSLQADFNINKTVAINGVQPVNGVITIGVSKGAGAANMYVNSFVIQGYDTAGALILNPTDLRALSLSQTTVKLQWQDRSAIETGYEVWRASDASGAYALVASLPANSTSYQDTHLSRGLNYYYIVRAVSNGNYSNYSNVLAVTTYSDAIYVAVNNTPAAPRPWNNLNNPGGVGTTWNSFYDSTGASTSLSMVQTGAFAGANSLGDTVANNGGVYPNSVMKYQYVLFQGNVGSFLISGLDLAKKYDITFLGSENYQQGDNSTAYIINGDSVFMNAMYNTNAVVTMRGVSPNSLGQFNLVTEPYTLASTTGWFNAMVIDGYTPLPQNPPIPPASGTTLTSIVSAPELLSVTDETTKTDSSISAYPNPFHSFFTLTVPADSYNEKVQVEVYDVNGQRVFAQQFENLVQGNNYLRIVPDQRLSSGVAYLVKVIYPEKKTFKVIKLIKE